MSAARRMFISLTIAVAAPGLALAAPAVAQAPPGAFQVNGDVNNPSTQTVADLAKLPQHKVRVKFLSGKGVERHTYRGPYLYDVVNQAQPDFDPDIKNDKLRFYVAATGSDGYVSNVVSIRVGDSDAEVDGEQAGP